MPKEEMSKEEFQLMKLQAETYNLLEAKLKLEQRIAQNQRAITQLRQKANLSEIIPISKQPEEPQKEPEEKQEDLLSMSRKKSSKRKEN